MKFVIPGKPQGKGRPRFTKYGHTYTPEATKEYEELVRQCYLSAGGTYYIEIPTKIEIWAYYEPNKSISKKKRTEQLNRPCIVKPDIDNISKIILDALNGIAYKDDNQIAELIVHKSYNEEARVEVEISVI